MSVGKDRKYILEKIIEKIKQDSTISDFIKEQLVYMIWENEHKTQVIYSLQQNIEDIQKSLKDPDSHKRI